MLNKEKMESFKNNFCKKFHNFFEVGYFLLIPMLLIFIVMFIVVFSDIKDSKKPLETTTIAAATVTTTTTTVPETTESSTETTTEATTETLPQTTYQETTKTYTTEASSTTSVETTQKKTCSNFGSFKSYTDYRCLSRSSAQWRLQEQAYTDENGLRKIGDAYLVAMGSYYGTTLSTTYQVTLSNGNSFTVMLCDSKADRHTDANNQVCSSNGSVIEFYVESDKMPSIVRQMGSVGALSQFSGSIVSIEKTA